MSGIRASDIQRRVAVEAAGGVTRAVLRRDLRGTIEWRAAEPDQAGVARETEVGRHVQASTRLYMGGLAALAININWNLWRKQKKKTSLVCLVCRHVASKEAWTNWTHDDQCPGSDWRGFEATGVTGLVLLSYKTGPVLCSIGLCFLLRQKSR